MLAFVDPRRLVVVLLATCVAAITSGAQRPAAIAPPTRFDEELFRAVVAGAPHQNVFISPLSAYVAMAMAYDGAAGATRDSMARALRIDARDDAEPDRTLGARLSALRGARQATVSIASSVWLAADVPVDPAYVARMKRSLDASATAADLTSPATVDRINGWVSRATKGRIPTMVGAPLPAATAAVLLNAVYFKGTWMQRFEPGRTRPRPFHLDDGTTAPRPAMSTEGTFAYTRQPGFQAIRLPYRGGQFSLIVLLPDSGVGEARVIGALTPGRAPSWSDAMTPTEVALQLPKFRIEQEIDLLPALRHLEMGIAFDRDRADFSRMFARDYAKRRRVAVDQVRQKTFVDVNEEGTEAAAATAVAVMVDSAGAPPVPFIVDRPFVAMLRDERAGTVLFLGRIVDPR